MAGQLIAGGRVVTADGVLDPGWVLVDNGTIGAVGSGAGPERYPGAAPTVVDATGRWVVPGFVVRQLPDQGHVQSGRIDVICGHERNLFLPRIEPAPSFYARATA